ncbi:MAG: Lipid A palmitoyltransferase PagP [Sodalis sp.]|nr:MAG: Lipid A palmitoyltransferase PagP [Sodalis sp.]
MLERRRIKKVSREWIVRSLYQNIIVLISLCALFSAVLAATSVIDSQPVSSTGLWQQFSQNVAETWRNSPHQDLYVPAITWHNRFTYDDEHIRRYNKRSLGAGYGISRYDEKGNWHAIYVTAFKDSFNKWEPFSGYAWEKQ